MLLFPDYFSYYCTHGLETFSAEISHRTLYSISKIKKFVELQFQRPTLLTVWKLLLDYFANSTFERLICSWSRKF